MEYVFIDTSVFEKNYFLEGSAINEILRLAEEGYIKILMPQLTYDEILRRIAKRINEAIERSSTFRKNAIVLKNIEALKPRFEEIDKAKCIEELSKMFKERLLKARVIILDYPILNIKDTFEKYFNCQSPFSTGAKKDEFPDAFTLQTLEIWCKKHKKQCRLLSHDNDFNSYQNELFIVDDFDTYLSNLQKEVAEKVDSLNDLVAQMTSAYETKVESLVGEIEDWAREQLSYKIKTKVFPFSYNCTIEFSRLSVEFEDYQLVKVTEDLIEINVNAYLSYELEAESEGNLYKDYDTGEWISEPDREIYDGHKSLNVRLSYAVPEAGREFAFFEIININDGFGLHL
jgi:predicted nucleic acid-binding protein